MEIIIIISLILVNGIFSMSEMSLVSSRKFKLENAKKKGHKGAITALKLSENPTRFLSTVQIGITLIGILLGVYSGENLTADVVSYIQNFELLYPYAENLATGIIVVGITYLSIVLGELFPKSLGMTYPEPIAIFLAKPMDILSKGVSPFVWLLTTSNHLIIRLFGIKKSSDSKISEEEIKSIIRESADGGEIQDIEQNIVERVFELGDRKVNSLLTHRNDLIYFSKTDSWEEIKAKINKEKHSAYPVCEDNNIDNVIGIVLLKDLFIPANSTAFNIVDYIRSPIFLNENTYAYKVLEIFKKEKMHYGLVVDEYGIIEGMVTMDDVVDALVGDVTEHDQDEYQITKRDENSWFVDGQYSVIDLIKYFDLSIEDNQKIKYTTVAGLLISRSNTLPQIGDKFMIDQYEFEVIDKDGQRIDKILVTKC